MTSLRPNLVKRIDRLPKPTNVAAAMQPLFEAISNSIHSVQAKFGDTVQAQGRVVVTVSTNRKKENVWATVEDNGVGLDKRNWDAFTTTDTDNKLTIGGKGVGRLLWLDCFERVRISSVFDTPKGLRRRQFDFRLANDDQIEDYKDVGLLSNLINRQMGSSMQQFGIGLKQTLETEAQFVERMRNTAMALSQRVMQGGLAAKPFDTGTTAAAGDTQALIQWQTASEVNTLGFYIQRAEAAAGMSKRANRATRNHGLVFISRPPCRFRSGQDPPSTAR